MRRKTEEKHFISINVLKLLCSKIIGLFTYGHIIAPYFDVKELFYCAHLRSDTCNTKKNEEIC